jgi:hypothetical protein
MCHTAKTAILQQGRGEKKMTNLKGPWMIQLMPPLRRSSTNNLEDESVTSQQLTKHSSVKSTEVGRLDNSCPILSFVTRSVGSNSPKKTGKKFVPWQLCKKTQSSRRLERAQRSGDLNARKSGEKLAHVRCCSRRQKFLFRSFRANSALSWSVSLLGGSRPPGSGTR